MGQPDHKMSFFYDSPLYNQVCFCPFNDKIVFINQVVVHNRVTGFVRTCYC